MYNDYLLCEICRAELTRFSQRQSIDSSGFVHSYCGKCYAKLNGR
ncbi:MAG: hypothetical protein N3F07_00250 [Candidatus Micrarchaeota archaeon]|nr:hypothetical protein [Candidatus Micrarchaeota archaeon]